MTIRELRKRLTYWQAALNLTQWRISVKWGARSPTEDIVGQCWWFTEEETCEITVWRSKHADPEETLIHELIHLVLEGHKDPKNSRDRFYELGINKISRALKEAKNGK